MKYFLVKVFKLFFSFVFICFFSLNAYALRCGNSLVTEGDSLDQVRKTCGEPDRKKEWEVRSYNLGVCSTMPMAEWVYSMPVGSGYHVLRFKDNKLMSITFER